MKRNFCSLLIVLSTMLAATKADAQIKFGIKAGANITNVSISKDVFSSSNRTGFLVGPMVDFKLPFLGLGFDIALQYDYKNYKLDGGTDTNLGSETSTFHMIEIPINVKWTFGSSKLLSAFVATGPQASWNVGSNNFKSLFSNTSQYSLKKSEFSWNVGVGVNFLTHCRLGYTYNIAIGSTAEVNVVSAVGDIIASGKLKSNAHQIYFAYIF